MNITTRARRTPTASTLAMAALAIAACTTEESIPEAPESATSGSIELGVTPSRVTFNDAGTAEYTAEWTADGDGHGTCEFVLTLTTPGDTVLHTVPVTGCDSALKMSLVDGAGELEAGEYRVELERDGERAEATFTVEK